MLDANENGAKLTFLMHFSMYMFTLLLSERICLQHNANVKKKKPKMDNLGQIHFSD